MIPYNRSGLMVSMVLVGALLSGNGVGRSKEPPQPPPPVIPAKAAPPAQTAGSAGTSDHGAVHLRRAKQSFSQHASFVTISRKSRWKPIRDHRPTNTPKVWPGIAAPFWALLNPAQSWRIFAPLPPDQNPRSRNMCAPMPPTRICLSRQAAPRRRRACPRSGRPIRRLIIDAAEGHGRTVTGSVRHCASILG